MAIVTRQVFRHVYALGEITLSVRIDDVTDEILGVLAGNKSDQRGSIALTEGKELQSVDMRDARETTPTKRTFEKADAEGNKTLPFGIRFRP